MDNQCFFSSGRKISDSSFTLSPQICRFKWIFLGLFLIMGLFLFPFIVFGAIPFEDNFNSYELGDLNGQGGWAGPYAVHRIVNIGCLEDKCDKLNGTGYITKTGDNITGSGILIYYLFIPIGDTTNQGSTIFYDPSGNPLWQVFRPVANTLRLFSDIGSYDLTTSLVFDTWNKITCEFEMIADPARMRCQYNEEDFTLWLDRYTYGSDNFSTIRLNGFLNWGWDYIAESEYERPLSGYTIIIEPIYPVDCQFTTTTSPISFNATGKITIPTENENWYAWFGVMAESYSTGEQFSTSTTFSPLLKAGDIYNYNLSFSLSDDAYKISYWLTGWNPGWQIPVGHIHYCEGTGIGTSLPEPEIIIPEFPGYEPEDCSEYALLEKLVCEIKNFLKSLVYPSTSKINELKTNLSAFRTKIPLNYLTASKDFMSDLNNQISTTTLSLKMFESATTTLDFSILNATNTLAGVSVSLRDILKTLTSTMLIFGFIGWAIAFKNRIFK